MRTVAIVEDEERISRFVDKGLRAAGYATRVAATAAEGVELGLDPDVDLVVLDLGLPDGDGMDVLATLRGSGVDIPVIVLTARTSVDDTVAVLEGGADDYLAKPFRFEELLARVRLRLRGATQAVPEQDWVLNCGGVRLDLRTREVSVDGRAVELSAREFALAEAFARHPGQVLSREQLLSRVWGYDFDPSSNVVDVYVRYLRRKLGAEVLTTVRGAGYRMEQTTS